MSYSRLLMRLWHRLTGRSTDFPLNVRVFHSVCLIIIAALAYNVPFNYLVGLKDIALLSACYVAIFSLVYYLSRFKGLTSIAFGVFVCAGNVLFTINYFLNSGIDGPTDLFFLLTMVIMITVAPVRQYWILVCVNLLLVTGLHLLQYMSPQLVPQSYTNLQNRYIDITSAYWVVMGLILFNFYFVRRNYEVERRSAEQKAELMKVLNEEKNKLFSIISHDLRAPLTNVQNYLELLTELEISEEESLVIKRKLLDSTRSTLDMLNNVLSWSQGQMTGLKFKLADLNAYDVLMPQLLLFTNIASNKNISVVISIDHDIRIVGNENMLQLIVRNLINNAIKFTASGGRIEVTASVDGESCIFSVLDSGNGSPVKLPTNIFYLNSGTTAGTANEKGVGLGLVLCKEFTEAMQGQIWFECGAESGTTFFVELPLSQPVVDAEGLTLV